MLLRCFLRNATNITRATRGQTHLRHYHPSTRRLALLYRIINSIILPTSRDTFVVIDELSKCVSSVPSYFTYLITYNI
jgi:hypothetical protein